MNIAPLRSALGSFALIFSAVSVPLAPGAHAQVQGDSLNLVVKIPFPFQINSRLMPPDTYSVRKFTSYSIVLLGEKSHDSGIVAIHGTDEVRRQDHASLFFHRYGNQYFLGRVQTTENLIAIDCARSGAEKKAARALELLTQQRTAPANVEVALTK